MGWGARKIYRGSLVPRVLLLVELDVVLNRLWVIFGYRMQSRVRDKDVRSCVYTLSESCDSLCILEGTM